MALNPVDTKIEHLGEARIASPIKDSCESTGFVSADAGTLIEVGAPTAMEHIGAGRVPAVFELAGPREKLYFDPSKLRCAVVTCGGLCPGLNAIIRSIVLELHHRYGVRQISGIRYGLQGFIPEFGHDTVSLTPESVVNIHNMGGTILGSSRGAQEMAAIVDCLERMHIGILFMIGGDGTLVAASKIAEAVTERNLKISVVGIPKTIDNDIHMIARSFGFDTAAGEATRAIRAAHNEARGYPNGIGLVKLMGRHSGFLAATAALAQQDVNFVLIPEVPFSPSGLYEALDKRLENRNHAVIVVAEGAGQQLLEDDGVSSRDPSGNIRLKDIGLFLKEGIAAHFKEKGTDITLKYIDPSYMIRSLPPNASDQVFCSFLARNAVHAGMAGKTGLLIGHWNNRFVHVPMALSAHRRKQVTPTGALWNSVLESTGQGTLA